MDRRSFLIGLLGAAGTVAIATTLPREASALAGGMPDDLVPRPDGLPPQADIAADDTPEGVEVAQRDWEWRRRRRRRGRYRRRHRRYRRRRYYGRRRVRRRRWRRRCWSWRDRWGRWRRSCRRYPFWFWIWI